MKPICINNKPTIISDAKIGDYLFFQDFRVFIKENFSLPDMYFITNIEPDSFTLIGISGGKEKILPKDDLINSSYWWFMPLPHILKRKLRLPSRLPKYLV